VGVGDELTVVSQVTRGVTGQGPVDESCNLEHDALPHRKPVQLAERRRDMITSPGARHEPGGIALPHFDDFTETQVFMGVDPQVRFDVGYVGEIDVESELITRRYFASRPGLLWWLAV